MSINWEMAAIPAALAIFITPYITKTLYGGATAVLKKKRRSRKLKWEDIPEGRIHECAHAGAWYRACFHTSPHEVMKACWESSTSIATIFNKAWRLSQAHPRYAEDVPESLPLGSLFLCTDAETILAFILCTVGKCKSSDWHPASLVFNDTRVGLEKVEGVIVAHIKGPFRSEREQLTKREISNMLRGWPPWYREVFKTRNSIDVPFPIAAEPDISRGGWIVAVGLMDLDLDSQKPMALYRSTDEPIKPGFRQNGAIFRKAVARCLDHIRNNVLPHFPDNQHVLDATRALNHLVTESTGSGMPQGGLGQSAREARNNIPHLRSSDCRFVCQNFNYYRELSTEDKTRLEPILFPTMAAAVHGAFEVIQYLKDCGMELQIPPDLQPLDREVWLRDCTTRLPIK